MNRELWTRETRKHGIIARASAIAGATWNDRVEIGTLAKQLRRAAYSAQLDDDCDLTNDIISELVSLAREAEALEL